MPKRFLQSFRPPYVDPSYPAGDYIDPSLYWGRKLGLPCLYQLYDDVLGDRHAELERRLSVHGDKPLLEKLLVSLRDRYPEIASLPCKDHFDELDVIRGCTSKFPARDIRFFLEVRDRSVDPHLAATARIEEDWRRLRIYRALGCAFEWRPSPETMGIVESHLGLPDWTEAAAGFKSAMSSEYAREWEW
ncbi:hypothetical protein HFO56_01635 [Rhizobium laguerreae]|uniref:hypothetical protein n=1 Tax=Rhizobium laguerreae TaxID=1076926 RepID=UPI001C91FF94|nr:hypothetical protein [Rhizobium laguerreae]MBY3151112.1 hypothetical protein [Rhizobium laguerreae]